jgi:HK97 family phage major capsid protein
MAPPSRKRDQLKIDYEAKQEEAKRLWSEFTAAREEIGQKGLDLSKEEVYEPLEEKKKAYEKAAEGAAKARDAYLHNLERGDSSGTKVGPVNEFPRSWSEPLIERYGEKAFDVSAGGLTVTAQAFDEAIRALPQRRLVVQSLIPRRQIDSDKFAYLRSTVFTNNAAETAAAALKPTSVISVERVEDTVRMIAHLSEALDRALLRDLDTVRDFVDGQLRLGLLLREDSQILNGTGVAPNIRGILNTSGVLSVARGTDPHPDAIYKGIMAVRNQTNPYEPTGIVVHPTDYQTIRLAKDTNGGYLLGELTDEDEDTLFGKQVVITRAIAQGTALVGQFDQATVYVREGAVVEWFTSGGLASGAVEIASRNLVVARAEEAVGLAVERPAAFAQVTGL